MIFDEIDLKLDDELIMSQDVINQRRRELEKNITESEKEYVKTMTENLDFSSDTSHVFFRIR